MSTQPTPPRGAVTGGRVIMAIGWLLIAGAVGMVILMVATKALAVGGVVVAGFVAAFGWIAIALGRNVEHSRPR